MSNKHDSFCNCKVCNSIDAAMFNDEQSYRDSNNMVDYVDSNLISKYLDGTLYALQNVNIYGSPEGKPIQIVKAGNKIGTVYSYVVRNGQIFWMLTDNKFVKHGDDLFDQQKLKESILAVQKAYQKKLNENVKKRQDANTNPLYRAGKAVEEFSFSSNLKYLKWLLITIVVAVIVDRIVKLIK
jgi:hypothetical protein